MKSIGHILLCNNKNSSYVPYFDQNAQYQNFTKKLSKNEILIINLSKQFQYLNLLLSKLISQVTSDTSYFSKICKSFLHACTPERRTRAYAHLFNQREHARGQRTHNISFKKMFEYLKRWANELSGAASEPHRFKYIVVGQFFSLEY
jgi:hypothetical protein